MTYKELSAKVQKAFRELRKIGYYCRTNYWCCQSCAWADVPKGKDKVVFWHKQDTEGARDAEKAGKTPYLYLAWSGKIQDITPTLRQAGLTVMSDGEDKRILVF